MKTQAVVDVLDLGGIVGPSPQMQALFGLLRRVAATDAPLLVVGEPGTCKEAFADGVHQRSSRRHAPFLVTDCGALSSTVGEGELFGYERDAISRNGSVRPGIFEAARGGTVFLGEVDDLSIDLQAKVLRAIEHRQIRRVGGSSFVGVDVRVMASTSRGLRAGFEEKRIRPDFYYRFTTVEVKLPPLRERLGDIPALVASIVVDLGLDGSREGQALLDPAFLARLSSYSWPGNVRQLRHYIERCSVLGDVTLPLSKEAFPPSSSYRVAPAVDSMRTMRIARKA
jgi:transcriptional regulator with PAS, ATPase and Fis domain